MEIGKTRGLTVKDVSLCVLLVNYLVQILEVYLKINWLIGSDLRCEDSLN